jgi:hypothetical protein
LLEKGEHLFIPEEEKWKKYIKATLK